MKYNNNYFAFGAKISDFYIENNCLHQIVIIIAILEYMKQLKNMN